MHHQGEGSNPNGMPMSGIRNHRLHPRVAEQIDVTIYATGLPAPVLGRTRDIGPEGVCVETESPVGLEGARRLVLHLEDGDPNLEVECCWQGNAPGREGVLNGFRFVDLEAEQTDVLWGLVFHRAREVASFLAGGSDLCGIAFDDALDVAMRTRLVRFTAGDWIYRQGATPPHGDSAYLILQGAVALEAQNASAESVYRDRVEPGALFGGLPLLAATAQPETAVAESACELLEIDRFSFRYLLSDRPMAGYVISSALAARYAARLGSLIADAAPCARDSFRRFTPGKAGDHTDSDLQPSGF